MNSVPSEHPSWCAGTHAAEWPEHSAEIGELVLSADVSYVVELSQRGAEQPMVSLLHHTEDSTELTTLPLEDAAYLSRALGRAVRLGSEYAGGSDNPVVAEVAQALRTLGAITRTNADALLGLTVAQLTKRERAAVLATFAVEGGDR